MDKLQMTQSPTTGLGSKCELQMPIELQDFFFLVSLIRKLSSRRMTASVHVHFDSG